MYSYGRFPLYGRNQPNTIKQFSSNCCCCCCYCEVASVVSDSVRPHRWQPTRLPRPWDSPGKNTGVGRHFLLQCMKVKSESEATQSCPTLCDPMDCSPPGSSAHGIFQARVLKNNKKEQTNRNSVHKAFFRSTVSRNSSVWRMTLCSQRLINLQSSLAIISLIRLVFLEILLGSLC